MHPMLRQTQSRLLFTRASFFHAILMKRFFMRAASMHNIVLVYIEKTDSGNAEMKKKDRDVEFSLGLFIVRPTKDACSPTTMPAGEPNRVCGNDYVLLLHTCESICLLT